MDNGVFKCIQCRKNLCSYPGQQEVSKLFQMKQKETRFVYFQKKKEEKEKFSSVCAGWFGDDICVQLFLFRFFPKSKYTWSIMYNKF